jgi:MFS family permease
VGRLFIGGISDIIGRRALAVGCALLQVGALFLLVWSGDLWMFYLFAVVFGFSWGGLGILITAIITDIFGMHSIGAIMGGTLVGWSIGAAVGPATGGFIYDVTGSYSPAFLSTVAIMLAASLLMTLVRRDKAG